MRIFLSLLDCFYSVKLRNLNRLFAFAQSYKLIINKNQLPNSAESKKKRVNNYFI